MNKSPLVKVLSRELLEEVANTRASCLLLVASTSSKSEEEVTSYY